MLTIGPSQVAAGHHAQMPVPVQDTHADFYAQLAQARLPSLPQALLQILDLAERDDVGMADMAEVVSRDTGLAAKVLGTANTAFYSRGRSIANIEQCLSVLGAALVRRIALNLSVAELFGRFRKVGGFEMRYYWHHVLCVAITARELARRLGYAQDDEAYLAGLLHDVGQLALLTTAPQDYLPLVQAAPDEAALMGHETRVFGLNHAEAGAWLAQQWNLHDFFADALRYHHEPLARLKDAHLLAQVVGLADHLHNQSEAGLALDTGALASWSLSPEEAATLVAAAQAEAASLAQTLGLEIAPRPARPRLAVVQDDPVQERLADAVATRMEAASTLPASLTDGSLATLDVPGTAGPAPAYLALLRAARLLFGSARTALFLVQDGALQGMHTDDGDSRLGEIRIRLPAPDSAMARALDGQNTLAGAQPAKDSLADAQVLRILASERGLCLPLVHAGQALGVLAVGLSAASAQIYQQRRPLLTTFAREAARRLAQTLAQAEAMQSARMNAQTQARAEFELHARQVVHEANNPLGVVRNYIALLREQITSKQAQEDFDLVESELRRVARILQDMKRTDAAGQAPTNAGVVDLNALIQDVIRFCRLGRPEMARVETTLQLEKALPAMRTNGDKLKQVLTNLVFNAAEAMPGGGSISITSAQGATPDQPSVEITVSDTGPGLPAEVLAHLYQPIKSNKGGAHQGLGLTIVGKLVEELGGALHCESSSQGTHFKILLTAGHTATGN